MASEKEPALEFIDMAAPEYFVTHIGKSELLAGGLVRNYMCVQRGKYMIVQYTVVVPVAALATMGRTVLQVSAEGHNEIEMSTDFH